MTSSKYTKAQWEELLYAQLENLNAVNDLLRIMKAQNDLIRNTNSRLEKEIDDFRYKHYPKLAKTKKG